MSGTPTWEPSEISERLRMIRRRRGLSLETAACLAGIGKSYLSMLERGERRFERCGLLENLANAVGCSVVDLTGEPSIPSGRRSADALATLPGISVALYDNIDDVVDTAARPGLPIMPPRAKRSVADTTASRLMRTPEITLLRMAIAEILELLHDERVRTLSPDLRDAGWKDWHILAVVMNLTVSLRMEAGRGPITAERVGHLADTVFDESLREEQPDDPRISPSEVTREVMGNRIRMVAT